MPTLNWIGKEAVVEHHRQVPTRLLECDPKLSVGDPEAENLPVEGDNLEALKALLPRYRGQVKCIYIDPPYNTGNEGWVYNDNVNDPRIKKWLGRVVGKEAEDLCRHDKWLCMMYPRLALLREFLREDGVIFVSIDDNEIDLLRTIMDELFGKTAFIATFVWQKRYSRENREAIGDVHEYVLTYALSPESFKNTRNRIPLDERSAKFYKNPNNDPRGRWRAIPMTAQGWRPNQMYEITTPSGRVLQPPEGRCWSTVESEFQKLRQQGRIWFGKKGDSAPGIIRYLDEVEGLVPWTWLPQAPSRWYLTGFLVPTEADEAQRVDPTSDDELDQAAEPAGLDDDETPERAAARRSYLPSSMGLSVLLPQGTKQLTATVRYGDYLRVEKDEGGDGPAEWRRIAREETLPLDFGEVGRPAPSGDGPQERLCKTPKKTPELSQPQPAPREPWLNFSVPAAPGRSLRPESSQTPTSSRRRSRSCSASTASSAPRSWAWSATWPSRFTSTRPASS